MTRQPRRRSAAAYAMFALLAAATLTIIALGWVVARDVRQSADAANQLSVRFGAGLDLIDDVLFETEEVRRVLLYALHTLDANRQLEYVDQSRAAEAHVRRLLEDRSPMLSTPRTRAARESVAAAWARYLQVRDEVVGLILENSVREGVALDEALGAARFNRVRAAIAELKESFEADAAVQVEAERIRSSSAITRLGLIVVSALLLVTIGVYLVNRRTSLEVVLRVKSEFLATMSHELRTPLTGVIGIAELLQSGDASPRQRELLRMLRTNATTLFGLINNVLDFSRLDAGLMALAPRRFSIEAPVEEALDAVSELASRKGLALGYVIAPAVSEVIADEERVRQVLLNLLSNAVKYTETGQVGVHVDATAAGGAQIVTMQVRDTGIGIPAAMQQRLFHWFSQIEPAGGRRAVAPALASRSRIASAGCSADRSRSRAAPARGRRSPSRSGSRAGRRRRGARDRLRTICAAAVCWPARGRHRQRPNSQSAAAMGRRGDRRRGRWPASGRVDAVIVAIDGRPARRPVPDRAARVAGSPRRRSSQYHAFV